MERKSALPVVFLDIAKAFDSVHHPSLLLKLHRMGVSDQMWWFIRAFLSDRFCAIWGDGATSDWFRVAAGVPQGSVLAPLLYAIFINDLVPDITLHGECECCLFADDVNIWPVPRDADGVDSLRQCLDRVSTWADTWRVRFGQKKCNMVLFSRRAPNAGRDHAINSRLAKLVLTRFTVERVPSYNFLGVRLDEQLRWREQARSVLQRAQLAAYNIARLVRPLKQPGAVVISRLCQSVLMPSMYYGLALPKPTAVDYDAMLSSLCLRRVLSLPRSLSRLGLG